MIVTENPAYSRDYLDPEKRSIANAVQVIFTDGSKTDRIEVPYPIGHRRGRADGIPLLKQKAAAAFAVHYGNSKPDGLMSLFADRANLESISAHNFVSKFGLLSNVRS